jgi:hypothetical protein
MVLRLKVEFKKIFVPSCLCGIKNELQIYPISPNFLFSAILINSIYLKILYNTSFDRNVNKFFNEKISLLSMIPSGILTLEQMLIEEF